MERSKTNVRIFSFAVVGYMLFALAWWAILLYQKTTLIYEMQRGQMMKFPNAFQEFSRQRLMIIGEGIVFALAMIVGVFLLNRAFRREMAAVRQQKNFLLSVTHELKSPITAIQLILDTFKKRELNAETKHALIDNGKLEAERLHKLVENLLLAARINPKETLSKAPMDVKYLLNELLLQYKRNYPAYKFELENFGQSFSVITNEPSLQLIVSNLLDNAVKYSGEGSMIKVENYRRGSYHVVSVADQGIGISSDEHSKIFQQFYRIGDEHTRSQQGTGLGLYLVKELCDKLAIKVIVKNNLPNGSIFELQIPQK